MIDKEITLSNEFKAQTKRAIVAIIFFVITYVLFLLAATGLTALCVYGGIHLIAIRPMLVTIALGIGLASMGVLILIFLVKFVFKSHKVDRSHLYEIRKTDEPELFMLIEEIVHKVGTSFPKKVYLSTDVNAAVFYDSSFWSMFFPIKKNLQIGLGLVNTVTKEELKAILAHEFGHFSQKTMKVGSYVYNVNQVIFNLLFDNESYEQMVQNWADLSSYFSIFVVPAVKIIEGVKWVLKKLYEVVNKSYMGLSREMEFHADEIAVSVTGFQPLKSSLLRMTLAEHSFSQVLGFYEGKIAVSQKSENLYKEQAFVMNFLASNSKIPVIHNFPEVTEIELNKFNKSKLVIKDQWASHPSVSDRIEMLEKTSYSSGQLSHVPANKIFRNIEVTQKELTNKIFGEVVYPGEAVSLSVEDFQAEFQKEFSSNGFSKVFNGYYDHKTPVHFEIPTADPIEDEHKVETLFSDHQVELVDTGIALQNDIEVLKQIADGLIQEKTFDYDGKKYQWEESRELLSRLETALEQVNEQIRHNDIRIFKFLRSCEQAQHKPSRLENLYREFFAFDTEFDSKNGTNTKLINELQFIHYTIPIEQIMANFQKIEPLETELKNGIKEILADNKYQSEITEEIKGNFEKYLLKNWNYFGVEMYNDSNLEMLFSAMNNFAFLLSQRYFSEKKNLLNYQEELIQATLQQGV